MHRTIICGVSAAVLALGLVSGSAAAQTVVVDGDHFDASKLTVVDQGCNDPSLVTTPPSARISHDPGPAPLGRSFVGWTPAAVGSGIGPLARIADPSKLSSYSIDVNSPNALASSVATVQYVQIGRPGVWKGSVRLPDDAVSGWHTVTVPGDTAYQWRHYTPSGQLDEAASGAMTLHNFVDDRGGDTDGALVGILYGCDGDPFFMDALRVVSGTSTRTYDFEGYQTRVGLSAAGAQRSLTITAGENVRLAAVLRRAYDGSTVSGRLQIDVRHLSDKKYRKYSAQTVDSSGTLATTARPTRSVIFRASYAGSPTLGPSGATFTVQVRTNVVAKLAKKQVVAGRTFQVRGRVAPGRRATVTLEKYVNGKWHTAHRARTDADGDYSIEMTSNQVGKSYWRVHAAGGGGNLQGNSVWLRLKTVKPPKPPGGGHHHTPTTPTDPTPPPPDQPPVTPPPPSGPL